MAVHLIAPQARKGLVQQPLAPFDGQCATPGIGREPRTDFKLVGCIIKMHQAEPAAKAPLGRFHQGQPCIADIPLGMGLACLQHSGGIRRHGTFGAPDARAFMLAVKGVQTVDEAMHRLCVVQRRIVHQLCTHTRVLVHADTRLKTRLALASTSMAG